MDGSKSAEVTARAGRLFSWLQGQTLEGYERSFKMSAHSLLENRFLMGIPAAAMTPEALAGKCRELAMPTPLMESMICALPGAGSVHFGFEEGPGSAIFKIYLEYWDRLNPARQREDETVLLHQAFKWDALGSGRSMVADYTCFLKLSREQTLQRIAGIYNNDAGHPAYDFASRLVALACTRTDQKLMYLEVSEAQNRRASFDLNFHAADLKLRDIEPGLRRMSRYYAIPGERFELLLDTLATKTLGHLSGGASRDGDEFMTLYYDPLG